MHPYLLMITLKLNALNSPIKRQRANGFFRRPNDLLLQTTQGTLKDTQTVKVKGWENTMLTEQTL